MNTSNLIFDDHHWLIDSATRPLAGPEGRLVLSRLLAGMSLRRRCIAPFNPPNSPTGAFNYRF
jgi:hypothetical protein